MREGNLWKTWTKTFETSPRALALVEAATGKRWSRQDLNRRALELSQTIFRGAKNRRVALCYPNSSTWVAAFLAIQKSGGCVIPLDAGTPVEGQRAVAKQCGADWLYSDQAGLVELRNRCSRDEEVCIKVTSGSSGKPKRILCQASHLLADGGNIIRSMGIQSKDRNLGLIPFGHSYGLGNLLMPLILQGTPLIFAADFVPGQIPDWIAQYRVTIFPSVPAVFRVLARMKGRGGLPPLRLAISAAAPLPAATAAAFFARFNLRMHNFYGSSETGGICFDRTGEASLSGRALGTPLSGVTVHLKGRGRIRVESDAVAHHRSSRLLNDYGEWTDQGELRYLGRVGSEANFGGKKVRPSEIENLLRMIEGVTEAWVTILDDRRGHYLAAGVESGRSSEHIAALLAQSLPSWKIPRVIKCQPQLPRTARGKLDFKQLKSWLED